jgi:hypothetical protein
MSHVTRTNRVGLMMSVNQGRPEVIDACSNRRDRPLRDVVRVSTPILHMCRRRRTLRQYA